MASLSLETARKDLARIRNLVGGGVSRLPLPEDPVAFARLCGIQPDGWQEEVLRASEDRVILACGRQVGKSTIVSIVCLHLALTQPNQLILIVARTIPQASELTKKVYYYYRELGRPVPARVDRQLSLELMNGSRIVTLPGAADNVRGYSAPSLVIIDEAAFIKDDLFFSLDPMMAVGRGRLFLLSTPNGKMGTFYEIWENGASEEWLKIRVPASECPRISGEYLADRQGELPWWVYEQEYEANFTETEESVFRYDDILAAVNPNVKALFPKGHDG